MSGNTSRRRGRQREPTVYVEPLGAGPTLGQRFPLLGTAELVWVEEQFAEADDDLRAGRTVPLDELRRHVDL